MKFRKQRLAQQRGEVMYSYSPGVYHERLKFLLRVSEDKKQPFKRVEKASMLYIKMLNRIKNGKY